MANELQVFRDLMCIVVVHLGSEAHQGGSEQSACSNAYIHSDTFAGTHATTSRIPFYLSHAFHQIRRVEGLEAKLKQIEAAISIFSRPKVFVQPKP
jgi:hypothetical protein